MKKLYSVKNFIDCVEKIKTPYPKEGLRGFLSGYVSSFTRETSPELIYFDGDSKVKIEKREEGHMTNKEIEDMLLGLLKYHTKGSDIHKRYVFAIGELFKRPIPKKKVKSPLKSSQKESRADKRVSFADEYPFQRVILKEPILAEGYRWEIGISGKANSLPKIKKFVSSLPAVFPEIYMLKYLKESKVASSPTCSKAEIYLETRELNIQKILDRIHILIETSTAKDIMPGDCSVKPKYMTNISSITGKPGNCIFTFSQGGEKVYEYKESSTLAERDVYFDGDSHYKFFGTLGVGIDIQKYLGVLDTIDNGGEIIKKLDDIDPEVYEEHLRLEKVPGDIKITENVFTDLLYTDSMTIQTFRNIIFGKYTYSSISFLHGVDSKYPIIIVMKPGFERNYKNAARVPSLSKSSTIINSKTLAKEAADFTFRNPKSTDPKQPCKDNWSWCNSRLIINDSVSFYDIDTILVPSFTMDEFAPINNSTTILDNIPNPFYARIIPYGVNIHKKKIFVSGEDAYKRGLSLVPDKNYYLSFLAFTDVQIHYMKRMAYYGLFKNSQYNFA